MNNIFENHQIVCRNLSSLIFLPLLLETIYGLNLLRYFTVWYCAWRYQEFYGFEWIYWEKIRAWEPNNFYCKFCRIIYTRSGILIDQFFVWFVDNPPPILRNLDSFPHGAFYSNFPSLQLGQKSTRAIFPPFMQSGSNPSLIIYSIR